jgi:uncharacterized protein (TIGR00296 family)
MEFKINLNQGELLVKKAREAVSLFLSKGIKPEPLKGDIFDKNLGVFVTINTYPDLELRGCIGFPYPIKPLGEGVIQAAIYAATEDFRFDPLTTSDLNKVVFEVSVLSEPELLKCKPSDREKNIIIPKHGLIINYGGYSGLLLPQVALEYRMNQKQFLEAVCQKAGLPKEMYTSPSAKIYTFEALIFQEEKPDGKVKQKPMVL